VDPDGCSALIPLAVVPFPATVSHGLRRTGILVLVLVLGLPAIGDLGGRRVGKVVAGATTVRRVCLAPVPVACTGTTAGAGP
jgi:hypothetical protein